MKKFKGWFIFILVIGILLALKWFFFNESTNQKGPGRPGSGNSEVVANYRVAKADSLVLDIFTTGKLEAYNKIQVHAESSGKIVWITDKEGKEVQKGELILKLNDSELRAQLVKLKAQLKLAEEIALRNEKLLAIKGLSQEEYDIQKSQVEVIQADVQLINAQLEKAEVKAPFNGILGLKNFSEGSVININDVIADLVQDDPMYVEFSIPEKYIGQIQKGMKLNFTTESENESLMAEVYAIEPKIDDATRSLKVRAKYTGIKKLVSGSFVKLKLDLKYTSDAILIPTSCIIPIFKGQKVFVCKNGVAKEVKVITGIRKSDLIQIISGINTGDTVLTSGLMSVKNDSRVKLIK